MADAPSSTRVARVHESSSPRRGSTDGGRDEQRPRTQREHDRQSAGAAGGGKARGRGRAAHASGFRLLDHLGRGGHVSPARLVDGLQLTVYDIDEARADLVGRGVDVSEPFHDVTGILHHAGTEARLSGPAPGHADYGSFVAFSDPDGNGWLLQEIKSRLPGR